MTDSNPSGAQPAPASSASSSAGPTQGQGGGGQRRRRRRRGRGRGQGGGGGQQQPPQAGGGGQQSRPQVEDDYDDEIVDPSSAPVLEDGAPPPADLAKPLARSEGRSNEIRPVWSRPGTAVPTMGDLYAELHKAERQAVIVTLDRHGFTATDPIADEIIEAIDEAIAQRGNDARRQLDRRPAGAREQSSPRKNDRQPIPEEKEESEVQPLVESAPVVVDTMEARENEGVVVAVDVPPVDTDSAGRPWDQNIEALPAVVEEDEPAVTDEVTAVGEKPRPVEAGQKNQPRRPAGNQGRRAAQRGGPRKPRGPEKKA